MTAAPANLLAVRRLLLDHLDDGSDDLASAEVGIVGDAAHRGGYHCGSDRVVTNDYSVVESSRDRDYLTTDASALDVGQFQVTSRGRVHNLRTFSVWCVEQCLARTPDSRDIREIIYSPDGRTVKRFDRLGKRSSGDSSHLGHTHFSFFRDSTKVRRDQTPLFRRYLTTIGLMEAPDMPLDSSDITKIRDAVQAELAEVGLTKLDGRNPLGQVYTRMAMGEDHVLASQGTTYTPTHPSLRDLGAKLDALITASAADATRDAEMRALLERVNAGGMTPAEFVDEVGRRLAPAAPEQ